MSRDINGVESAKTDSKQEQSITNNPTETQTVVITSSSAEKVVENAVKSQESNWAIFQALTSITLTPPQLCADHFHEILEDFENDVVLALESQLEGKIPNWFDIRFRVTDGSMSENKLLLDMKMAFHMKKDTTPESYKEQVTPILNAFKSIKLSVADFKNSNCTVQFVAATVNRIDQYREEPEWYAEALQGIRMSDPPVFRAEGEAQNDRNNAPTQSERTEPKQSNNPNAATKEDSNAEEAIHLAALLAEVEKLEKAAAAEAEAVIERAKADVAKEFGSVQSSGKGQVATLLEGIKALRKAIEALDKGDYEAAAEWGHKGMRETVGRKAAVHCKALEALGMTPQKITALGEYLDGKECDHTHRHTIAWLTSSDVESPVTVLEVFKHFGGYCDCEVLRNALPWS